MHKADKFVNTEDTLQTQINPQGLLGENHKEKHVRTKRREASKSKLLEVEMVTPPWERKDHDLTIEIISYKKVRDNEEQERSKMKIKYVSQDNSSTLTTKALASGLKAEYYEKKGREAKRH